MRGFHPCFPVVLGTFLGLLCLAGCKPKSAGGTQRPPVPVVTQMAGTRTVIDRIELIGTLQAEERVTLQSEVSGQVQEILFQEGQSVRKGDVLVTIDQEKLATRLQQAEADLALAASELERAQTLLQSSTIAQQEYDRKANLFNIARATVELRRQEKEEAVIQAPFDGRVGSRVIGPGQFVNAGTTITTIVSADPVKVDFQVPERYSSRLQVEQEIEITVAAFPGEVFIGKVYFIAPEVEPSSRTVLVRARIPNPEWKLKPGMFVNLRLILESRHDAVVLPEIALIQRGDLFLLALVEADNRVQFRTVQPGARFDGQVEIKSGLSPGQRVVVEGQQKIGPGSTVVPKERPPVDATDAN